MSSRLFTLLVVSGLLVGLGVGPVSAQMTTQVRANIPFEFMVGGQTLPAGEYTVNPQLRPSVLGIRNKDTSEGALVLTNPVEAFDYSYQAKLVFHRYGSQYFLSEIWTLGSSTGYRVPQSKVEREASRTAAAQRQDLTILAQR